MKTLISLTQPEPSPNIIPPVPSPNLTTEEAAKFLSIKASTLEQWRWNGKGPLFVKIGRSCRYRHSDLEAFLEDRVFTSTTQAQNAAAKRLKA
jgi:excisionase family DNA binding protein